MTNIMFLLAALVFAFGLLIGSALQTHSVDRRYRQVAQRVQELHELAEALAAQAQLLARRGPPRARHQSPPRDRQNEACFPHRALP